MAKIKYDKNGEAYLSGTVGRSLTFLLWRGVRVVKSKPVRRGSLHHAQIRLSHFSRAAARAWRKLTTKDRSQYIERAGKNAPQTGYQLFVKEWWQHNGEAAAKEGKSHAG